MAAGGQQRQDRQLRALSCIRVFGLSLLLGPDLCLSDRSSCPRLTDQLSQRHIRLGDLSELDFRAFGSVDSQQLRFPFEESGTDFDVAGYGVVPSEGCRFKLHGDAG
jgi:hypothetical protein